VLEKTPEAQETKIFSDELNRSKKLNRTILVDINTNEGFGNLQTLKCVIGDITISGTFAEKVLQDVYCTL
jgi:hypothetical protein